jgi:uncharacterized membrane protein YjgN (DUF898 family)
MREPIEPSFESAATSPRELGIRFTGSGSEYFRIWIVNLLLIVVTFSLYVPFARARRIRYFYANTLVDGQALAFHGDPWRMFRGYLLLLVLGGAYSLAGHVSPGAAVFAFLLLCVIWPALWRSALRFRLGNTSWRGLRFSFRGDLPGAYKAMLPIYLPVLPMLLLPLFLDPAHPRDMPIWVGFAYLLAMLGWLLFWPWGLAQIKRYQHRGYALGREQADIDLSTASIYGLVLKGFGLCVLTFILAGILVAVVGFASRGAGSSLGSTFLAMLPLLTAYLIAGLIFGCWGVTRLQNLVWSGTHSPHLQFTSVLRARSYMGLCIKNWLLTAVTLGLFRPFAVVAATRMRLQAVGIDIRGGYEGLVADTEAVYQDATGDASGDFFGIDLGL